MVVTTYLSMFTSQLSILTGRPNDSGRCRETVTDVRVLIVPAIDVDEMKDVYLSIARETNIEERPVRDA